MPTISGFYGISIRMVFGDHPPPHFHAYYTSSVASNVARRTSWVAQEMREVVHVHRYRITGPYRLWRQFTDGLAGEWDFLHLAISGKPVTAAFRDHASFNEVFLDFGALTWPDGYDWSPEALHTGMKAAGVLKLESAAA